MSYQRYECFNCNKNFEVAENGMCPYCHAINITDRGENKDSWKDLVYPCCGGKLPAPIEGAALVICPCGKSWLPETIREFNERKQEGGK